MTEYLILCVDDEREVLDSVLQDLDDFEEHFIIEGAESVDEARSVIADHAREGAKLALILCDHIMPEQTGVSFLIELSEDEELKACRKVLLTGQAGHEDTIERLITPVWISILVSLGKAMSFVPLLSNSSLIT
ncbi:response regulator [Vibrio variabilis]|uniref:Response regulator n=1 Tax=Vibrio variabilis TaxID=990271 RepID=A0ABQ0JL59_9VIBR|nr:response regulator [Vibrio variabilis]